MTAPQVIIAAPAPELPEWLAVLIQPCEMEARVKLTPKDMLESDFDALLLARTRVILEGKCHPHGYVMPGSVQVLTYTVPIAEHGRFTADFQVYVSARTDVFRAPSGYEVHMQVQTANKAGVYGIVHGVLSMLLPRELHLNNPEFTQLRDGDMIRAEILESRLQMSDSRITAIGKFLGLVLVDTRSI